MFKRKHKHVHKPAPATKDVFNDPWSYKSEDNPVYRIAIVIDDEVQEIMTTQTRLAALLLSEPKFVDITKNESNPQIGWGYIDSSGEFVNLNEIKEV
jgi:hypothetical protein